VYTDNARITAGIVIGILSSYMRFLRALLLQSVVGMLPILFCLWLITKLPTDLTYVQRQNYAHYLTWVAAFLWMGIFAVYARFNIKPIVFHVGSSNAVVRERAKKEVKEAVIFFGILLATAFFGIGVWVSSVPFVLTQGLLPGFVAGLAQTWSDGSLIGLFLFALLLIGVPLYLLTKIDDKK
jgi:hypothetical protein